MSALISTAYSVATPACHTEPPPAARAAEAAPAATAGNATPPDFTVSFGTEVEECVVSVRLPIASATIGVACLAIAMVFRRTRL
jgi:hypothetical protein